MAPPDHSGKARESKYLNNRWYSIDISEQNDLNVTLKMYGVWILTMEDMCEGLFMVPQKSHALSLVDAQEPAELVPVCFSAVNRSQGDAPAFWPKALKPRWTQCV